MIVMERERVLREAAMAWRLLKQAGRGSGVIGGVGEDGDTTGEAGSVFSKDAVLRNMDALRGSGFCFGEAEDVDVLGGKEVF